MSRAGGPASIRPARAEDAARIAALHGKSFASPWDEASFAGFLADPSCITLVAESAGEAAGFITARGAGEEADIVTLAVAPEARCQGVGRKLVDALAAALRARGAAALFLEVGEDNHAAVSLYRRAGFTDAGRRPGYYATQNGEPRGDALVLRLDL